MTNQEALAIIGYLATAFVTAKLDESNVETYRAHMLDLPYAAAKQATESIVLSSKFFPSIAEIRETTLRHTPNVYIPTPSEAWANVAEQLQHAGTWHAPSFAHPLISRAVRTMGWYDLCRSDNPMADRAHFLRIYGDLRDTSWRQALCALPDAHNGHLIITMTMDT